MDAIFPISDTILMVFWGSVALGCLCLYLLYKIIAAALGSTSPDLGPLAGPSGRQFLIKRTDGDRLELPVRDSRRCFGLRRFHPSHGARTTRSLESLWRVFDSPLATRILGSTSMSRAHMRRPSLCRQSL